MERMRGFWRSPASTLALLALGVALLVAGGIGGVAAAPAYVSGDYTLETSVTEVGVALVENGGVVGDGGLLGGLVPEGEPFRPGKVYDEELAVSNPASDDAYVRVTVRAWWADAEGGKLTGLEPGHIDLGLVTDGGWHVIDADTTKERTVLYYEHVLPAGGTTPPFMETLSASYDLPLRVTQETVEDEAGKTITTYYEYEDVRLVLEATADAVQTHNAEQAILSAWGRTATLSGTDVTVG